MQRERKGAGLQAVARALLPCARMESAGKPAMVYIRDIYYIEVVEMAKKTVAKLFKNGRSQAVRLPREFRFEGDRVRIRRMGKGVLLEPMPADPEGWVAEL